MFAALKKRERREVEGRAITKQRIALVGANNVSPPWRAYSKVSDWCLTPPTFSWK
jgi:hypothetical protein